MAVYYKFKSAKDYDSIPIDGHFISVANLKEKIFESKHLGRGTDFDLMVSNAQTNEEYADEAMLIPKNTSVLVRRVPGRPRMPIVTERDEPKALESKVEEIPQSKSSFSVADSSTMRFPEESEWDEFGNDLYAIPEVVPVQLGNPVQDAPPPNKADEDSKIKALIDTPALDWQWQAQEAFGPGRGFGRGMGGRMMSGRGFGRGGGLERKTPPQGYICHRCKVPGHFIQHCPTNGDPNFDIRRAKPPTGIPKSMLMATPDGSYALPSGAVAVLRPNEAAFEKEIEGLPSARIISDLPPELHCPLCKEVMKDAVLTSKCCFMSFCDKCIRDHIISKSVCVCSAPNILADDLLPNKTVRETINRILESTTSSAENAGSLVHVQDMESARCPRPKVPSPTLSAAVKEEHTPHLREVDTPVIQETVKEGNTPVNVPQRSLEKNHATKNIDQSEATLESASVKEATSQGSAPQPEEEVQQKLPVGEQVKKKKKKKMRPPSNAADLQWKISQDLPAENYAMPFGPSAYNPYLGGMQQWGMDGYMMPYAGSMPPYLGYTPGIFDAPFGGVLPQDPFAVGGQGYMMPVVPQRDLSLLGICSNPVPQVMTREEFEARKADLRRRREIERRGERERSKDRECSREMSSGADISSIKSKPRLMSQAASAASMHRPERERAASLESHRESLKRKSSDYDDEAKADRKQKGSVFSRISFPESGEGNKSRKLSEPPANGYKDHEQPPVHHHRSSSNGYRDRDDWKPPVKGGGVSSGGRKSSSSSVHHHHRHNDHDSSSDEDYHFKRKRPSSTSRHDEEEEDGSRVSRSSRERGRGGGGGGDHHERDRLPVKHR